jgi:hypothetical protein
VLFASLSDCIDEKLQEQICSDVTRHLHDCDACIELLHSLRDTVRRMQKGSTGKPSPHLAIRKAILEQYQSAMKSMARKKAAGA